MIAVINARTMAVSEYGIDALDVVAHGDELYFVQADGLVKLDADGDEAVSSYIQTGQLDFGSTTGKRCTSIEVDTEAVSPSVYLIDQTSTEYPTTARSGAGTKRKREYNAPRGVLSNRFGVKVSGPALDISGLSITTYESGRK